MNKLTDNVYAAFAAIFSNIMRAILTTIGIGIGIASVVILVSLGNAVQAYINNQFLSAGSDLITINSGSDAGPAPTARTTTGTLTEKDLAQIQDPFTISNVKVVAALLQVSAKTDYTSSEVSTTINGTVPAYFDIQSRTVASGRLFDATDVDGAARVAVLGQTTVSDLFPSDVNPVGETIRIGGIPFKVIGTLQKSGGSGVGNNQDSLIAIPLTTAQTKLQSTRSVTGQLPLSTIYVKVSNVKQIDVTVTAITSLLHTTHKIKVGKDNDFSVSTNQDTVSSLNSIITVLTIFLGVVGGISLLVGGIGVMNIMLVSVTERTKEIGLRKAVGARYIDVLFQFLTESIVLCFVGAFAGLLVSVVVMAILRLLISSLNPSISTQSIVLAVSVTTLIGVFFGLYPASRAAALTPIKALRTE